MPRDHRPMPLALVRCVGAAASAVLTAAAAVTVASGAALPAAAAATGNGPSRGHAASVARGAIGGVVRGPDGAAVGRVCVVASGRSGTAAGFTGPGGRYLIQGLAPGAYTVAYSDCGRPGRYLNEWYGGSLMADQAALVRVTAGPATWLSPVTMRPARAATLRAAARAAALRNAAAPPAAAASGASISGTVTNAAGKPLTGVCVEASAQTANTSFGVGSMTGRGGHYSFRGLRAGAWKVSFANGCGEKYAPQWWKHASSVRKAAPIHLRKGRHVTGIDARLVIGGVITGTVRGGSSSGPGLSGVCVIAQGTGRAAGVFQQAVSHAGGSYRVSGLGTGGYQLQFFPECGAKGSYLPRSRKVAVTVGKTTAGVNVFLTLAAEISGTVTAAHGGAPLAGICVAAFPAISGSGNVIVVPTQTGKNGGYTVNGLSRGTYVVSFSGGCGNTGSYAPQSYKGQADSAAANPVTLTTGQHLAGIDASMRPGGTVTGKVTNRANAALAGICVLATSAQDAGGFGASPDGLLLGDFPLFTDVTGTRADGRYRIANLAPGSYEVGFSSGCSRPGANNAAYAPQWFAPQGGNRPAWLSVRPGIVTSGISSTLRPAAMITGVVKDAVGKPVRGICPVSFALTGQPLSILALFLISGPSVSGSNGSYRITGLATGKYAVGFAPCHGQPYAFSWFAGKGSIRNARQVAVTDGKTTSGINQTMRGGQSVSGTVRSGVSGSPQRSVCVAAVDSGGFVDSLAFTGKTGGYLFKHLTLGRYSLDAFDCGPATNLADVIKPVRVASVPVTGVSVTLPVAGLVAGTVTGGSPPAPTPGICVEAIPQTGNGMAGTAISGPAGSYVLGNLASGTYLIRFTSLCPGGSGGFTSQWFNGQQNQAQATPVLVSAGSTHGGVNAALAADGAIGGTVQVSGKPAAGVCVVAYLAAGHQPPAVAETGGGGSYQIGGLDAGSYVVEFKAGCGIASYATQWYNGVATRSAATPVVVTAGSITPAVDAH